MFNSGQMTIDQAQWRGMFIKSLYKVFQDNHPGIGVEQAVVERIEELVIRLLFELLDSRPVSTQDLEKRIQATFPAPINEWATVEAENAVKYTGKKHHSKMSAGSNKPMLSLVGKVHPMLRDHLGYKIDEKVTLYVISVLEYIASDIIKTTGNYVKNIRNTTATVQDLNIALRADKVLMDIMEMLYNDEGEHPTYAMGVPENGDEGTKQKAPELTYEKASRDLIHEESQYLREINLLVHVFKRDFELALGNDGKEYVEKLFGNIVEIHELTVSLLRSLEDAVEMSDNPCMGSCFWALAEGQEFDVYHTYVEEFCRQSTSDVIERLLELRKSKSDVPSRAGRSQQASHTNAFRLAVKYVLPTLLQAPVFHCYRYMDYLTTFRRMADNEADIDDLIGSQNYFDNLKAKLDLSCNAQLKRQIISEQNQRGQPETQRSNQLRRLQEIQKTIEGWEGNEIGFTCSEFIRDGSLMKLRPKQGALGAADTLRKGRGTSFTERHVFLFDHLIVLCKLTHRPKERNEFKFKFKEKLPIRKTEIFDLDENDDLKNAFEICYTPPPSKCEPQTVWTLCCKHAEVKQSWMSALVMLQTRSMLDRMLDVYLKEEEKRIPLVLPTQEQYRFAEPDTDENIFFEDYTSSSGIPVVKNGTVVKLVERLTYHLYADNKYVATFLTTFRSFCSPDELLNLLIERFHVPTPMALMSSHSPQINGGSMLGGYNTVQSPSLSHHNFDLISSRYEQNSPSFQRFRKEYMRPIQLRVLYVIRQWVNNHWYDFERDPDLLVKLEGFIKPIQSNLHKKFIQIILTCIDRRRRNTAISEDSDRSTVPRPNNVSDFGPKPLTPVWHTARRGDVASYDLLTLHPLEIGRQVTLLQSDLYRAVKPIELVGAAWTKHDKDIRSPQLLKLTHHSTMLTYWIARAIVETASMEERVAMFSRVLEVMSVFEELNNFTGLVAFYSALNSSSVYRLKACWEKLDREKQASYSRFKSLCNPHWTEMIERLRSINPPCVPFFGHYLSRIFFFEEGNSTFVSHPDEELNHDQQNSDSVSIAASKQPLVSFTKCRKIASIIADIQMYQNQPYALQIEPSIRQFFETINPLSGFDGKEALETYLFDQSHRVEPKDPEKWETVKPSRPAHVLKSPGIKPPKISVHHQPLHQNSRTHKSALSPTTSFNSYVTDDSRQVPSSPTEDNAFAIVDINPGQQPRYVRDVPNAQLAQNLPGSQNRTIRSKNHSISTPPSPTHTPAPPLPPRRQASPLPPPPPKSLGLRDKSNSPRSPLSPAASAEAAFVFPPRKATGLSASSTGSNLSPESCSPLDSGRRAGSAAPPSSSSPSPPTVPPRRPGDMLPTPLPLDAVNKVWNGQVGPYNTSATLSPPPKMRSTSASSSSSSAAAPALPPRTPRGSVEPPPRPPKRAQQRASPVTPLSPINNIDNHRSSSVPHGDACVVEAPPLPPKTYKPRRDAL